MICHWAACYLEALPPVKPCHIYIHDIYKLFLWRNIQCLELLWLSTLWCHLSLLCMWLTCTDNTTKLTSYSICTCTVLPSNDSFVNKPVVQLCTQSYRDVKMEHVRLVKVWIILYFIILSILKIPWLTLAVSVAGPWLLQTVCKYEPRMHNAQRR